jgi:CRP-like cAMP-binding protein
MDKEVIRALSTRMELRKGDVLLEEGDLFQRIYTITKGSFEAYRGDRLISTMKEGEVIGEASLLHLRPIPVTIKVASETATVLVIPAHKLNELINSNPVIAVRVYKKIAGLVESKIESALQTKHQLVTELCPENAKHVPSRLNL